MADGNNFLLKGKKRVYLYNTKSSVHELVGALIVDKDAPLMDGQTEVAPQDNVDHQYWNGTTWVTTIIITYGINNDKSLGAITRHPQGYILQANETFTKPADGLYEPKWNGSTWVGISAEEYLKKHPVEPAKPTSQDVAMAGLLKDAAQFKATSTKQDILNAQLLKDLMAEKQKSVKQDTLNAQLLKDVASLKLQLKNSTTTA